MRSLPQNTQTKWVARFDFSGELGVETVQVSPFGPRRFKLYGRIGWHAVARDSVYATRGEALDALAARCEARVREAEHHLVDLKKQHEAVLTMIREPVTP